jgi:hypothetical protein
MSTPNSKSLSGPPDGSGIPYLQHVAPFDHGDCPEEFQQAKVKALPDHTTDRRQL